MFNFHCSVVKMVLVSFVKQVYNHCSALITRKVEMNFTRHLKVSNYHSIYTLMYSLDTLNLIFVL